MAGPYAGKGQIAVVSGVSFRTEVRCEQPTLTTSKGDVTMAPVIPPRLGVSSDSAIGYRADLPAAECFHPCSFFGGSGGESVDGGVDDDAAAEGSKVDGPGMDEAVTAAMVPGYSDRSVRTKRSVYTIA